MIMNNENSNRLARCGLSFFWILVNFFCFANTLVALLNGGSIQSRKTSCLFVLVVFLVAGISSVLQLIRKKSNVVCAWIVIGISVLLSLIVITVSVYN